MSPQQELFENLEPTEPEVIRDYLDVPGLSYLSQLLTPEEQESLLAEIDKRPWLDDLRRRVQHYGYKYDYRERIVDPSMRLGDLPTFARGVADKLLAVGLIGVLPDQAIVNEYEPGQGISAHVDCEPCFQDGIVTVSLGSAYEMDFLCIATKEVRSTMLAKGSALVMRESSRYDWMHRIKARKSDHGVPRGRRVSLTFRNVILET